MKLQLATLGCALAVLLAVASAAPRKRRQTDEPVCSESIPNCDVCANPALTCLECGDGQILSDDEMTCINCPRNCAKCQEKQSGEPNTYVSECETCMTGYVLVDVEGQTEKQCLECAANCNSCENNKITKCDEGQCKTGYRFNPVDMNCLVCTERCVNCDGNEDGSCNANSCQDRTVLLNGLCEVCGSNCQSCSEKNKCDNGQCDEGYAYDADSKTCRACDANCQSCSQPGKCDDGKCNEGFALADDSTCGECTLNCLKCSSPGTCDQDSCAPGFVINSADSTCQACPTNCETCTMDDAGVTTCTVCFDKFEKIDEITCDRCPDNCDECEVIDGLVKCKSGRCAPQFALDSVTGTCVACPANCIECSYNQNAAKTMCRSGRCDLEYVDRQTNLGNPDGKCYKCPDFCSNCRDTGSATECIFDFCKDGSTFNIKDNKCVACPDKCNECFVDENNAVLCVSCESLYTPSMDWKSCKKCPTNCEMCYTDLITGSTLCYDEQCQDEFYFDSTDKQCKDCGLNGCLRCAASGGSRVCIQCDAGYAMTSTSTCSRCSNCEDDACAIDPASNSAKCSQCKVQFALNTAGQCVACPRRCDKCTATSLTETVCESNGCEAASTFVASKTCVACPIGCSSCSYTQDGVFSCATCMAGYEAKYGVCHACPENCLQCDYIEEFGRTECTTCASGYFESNSMCLGCGTACSKCDNNGEGKCDVPAPTTYCSDGFWYSSSTQECSPCMSNCALCEDDTTCDACKTGYDYVVPDSGTPSCSECADRNNCEDCSTSGPGLCDLCKVGYVINTDKDDCVECPDGCAYCDTNSPPTCKHGMCMAGYVMDQRGICRECPEGCASCYMETGTDTTKCFMGYCKTGQKASYVQGADGTCYPCPSDSVLCTLSGTTTSSDADGCINFATLVPDSSDVSVEMGWTKPVDVNGDCQECDPSCDQCGEPGKCNSNKCQTGMYAVSDDGGATYTCADCPAGCDVCSFDATNGLSCSHCSAYFTEIDDSGVATNCTDCATSCSICDTNGPTFCDSGNCDIGTYFNDTDNLCYDCMPSCGSCDSDVTCSSCDDGFFFDETTCAECGINCRTCDAADECMTCLTGFGPTPNADPKNCTECSIGCDACDVADDFTTTCTECKQEYTLVDGECIKVTCTDSSTVGTVGYQFFSQSGRMINPEDDLCLGDIGGNAELPGCLATSITLTSNTAYASSYCPEGFCRRGYLWMNDACIACPAGCGNCYHDGTETVCLESGCKYKYTRTSTGQCVACPLGCSKCTVDGSDNPVCDAGMCEAQYQEVAAETCLACYEKCDSCNLQTATNRLLCSKCATSFVVNEDTCFGCADFCSSCAMNLNSVSETTCNTCEDKYVKNSQDNTCKSCPAGCAGCDYSTITASTTCQANRCSMSFGQLQSDFSCLGCPSNCELCEEVGGQMSCFPGGCEIEYFHYLDNSGLGQCRKCIDFCNYCLNEYECLDQQCSEGYGLTSAQTCASCNDGCMTCDIDENGNPTCLVCFSEFVLYDGSCKACPSNCLDCTYNVDTTTTQCKSGACKQNHCQSTSTNDCMECPSNSVGCEFKATTSQCSALACDGVYGFSTTGTGVDAVRTCSSCGTKCMSCSSNAASCDQCEMRYTVEDGICKACGSNCFKCTTAGQCDSDGCDDGYVAVATDDQTTCKKCADNCVECEEAATCTTCAQSYVLNDALECEMCPDNCYACEWNQEKTAKLCTQCDSNYTINADAECTACPGNCVACHLGGDDLSEMICDSCVRLYTLNDGECGNCPRNCEKCSVVNGNYRCTECSTEYALEELTGTCSACPRKCSECKVVNSVVTCEECYEGYKFDSSGQCASCRATVSNCVECMDADENGVTMCEECDWGYTLRDDGQACLPCTPTGCAECVDLPLECTTCMDMYEESEDGTTCGTNCYHCTGDNCPSDPTTSDSVNVTFCDSFCVLTATRPEKTDTPWINDETATFMYTCADPEREDCPEEKSCVNGDTTLDCCCKGNGCYPIDGAPTIHKTVSALLLAVLVSLVKVMF